MTWQVPALAFSFVMNAASLGLRASSPSAARFDDEQTLALLMTRR